MRRLFSLLLLLLLPLALPAGEISGERQNQLRNLLLQDCGSCHGMHLTGGLGPPLTSRSLAGKPYEFLVATVREGRPGTPMPPWKRFLSDADIDWLVRYLRGVGSGQ